MTLSAASIDHARQQHRTLPDLRFSVGDNVTYDAMTDCFGKDHAAVTGLVVVEVIKHDNPHAPHWRLKAIRDTGDIRFIEANQDFFSLA